MCAHFRPFAADASDGSIVIEFQHLGFCSGVWVLGAVHISGCTDRGGICEGIEIASVGTQKCTFSQKALHRGCRVVRFDSCAQAAKRRHAASSTRPGLCCLLGTLACTTAARLCSLPFCPGSCPSLILGCTGRRKLSLLGARTLTST